MDKINILYLTKTLDPDAPNKIIFTLAKNLDSRLFDSHVCSLYSPNNNGSIFNKMGIPIIELDLRHHFDILKILKLVRYSRENDIHIIHTHYPLAHLYGLLATRILKIPLIFTSHDHDNWSLRPKRLIPYILMQCSLPFTDYIITVSNELQKHISQKKYKKIFTIYNGLDLTDYFCNEKQRDVNIINKLEGDKNIPIIGTVSRLSKEKGIDILIKATRILKDCNQHIYTVIVGSGPLEEELVKLARKKNVEELVLFLGYRADIPNILNSIDIFILPSHRECTSLALLEAMAASKPIIATNVGGNPELIQEGKTGILIPPNNPEILAKKILLLLNDKDRPKLGSEARKLLQQNFSVQKMVNEYEKIYKRSRGLGYD
jgi:glycosyltransferase involved in cell wall biosynthesis